MEHLIFEYMRQLYLYLNIVLKYNKIDLKLCLTITTKGSHKEVCIDVISQSYYPNLAIRLAELE